MHRCFIVGALAFSWITNAHGQENNAAELANKLSNPVADLISIPFQFNYNDGIGPVEDGSQTYLNFQPVIPFHLNKDWNLISRTILPVVARKKSFRVLAPSSALTTPHRASSSLTRSTAWFGL